MRKSYRTGLRGLAFASLLASLTIPAAAQQASLNLQAGDAQLTHYQTTGWSLAKSAALDGTTVTWTVNAVKGGPGHAYITASGLVTVNNGGTANAMIGNIVINLQKK